MNKYNGAINIILQVLGEQTIEGDLSIEGIYEAEQADIIIEATKEEVLAEGWSFNTDENWALAIDTEGYITTPSTALRIDPSSPSANIIVKGGKLYDKTNQTYKFTTSVGCDIVWDLDFDELPLPAQQYIVLKSARIAYQRLVGDLNVVDVLMKDEQEAKLRLNVYEDDVNDYNIFDDTNISRIISRTTNPVGVRG
jgi:hypothetical protein